MTVFCAIAKEFLIRGIQDIRDRSRSADSSSINVFLSSMSWGRDPDLSAEKRKIAERLWISLEQMEEAKTDEETFKAIETLLTDAKTHAAQISKEKNYTEGAFGPAMEKIILLLQSMFKKLEDAGLIDVPMDGDALNIFSYHAGHYLIKKIEDDSNSNLINAYIKHPKVTSFAELASKKERVVLHHIKECKEKIDALDSEKPDYEKWRKNEVVEYIGKVLFENSKLCTQYGTKLNLPVHLVFFTKLNIGLPTLKPDEGYLKDCMEKAIEDIGCQNSNEASASKLG